MKSAAISLTLASGATVTAGEVMMSAARRFLMGRATQPLLCRQEATRTMKFWGSATPMWVRKSFSEMTPTTRPASSTTGTPEMPRLPMAAATSAKGVSGCTETTSRVMISRAVTARLRRSRAWA